MAHSRYSPYGYAAQSAPRKTRSTSGGRIAYPNNNGFDYFVCGINLKKRYAGLAVEVIHVHHEEPLSDAKGEREFDPVATMKPVCPNCHAVIHSRSTPFSVDEVRYMLDPTSDQHW